MQALIPAFGHSELAVRIAALRAVDRLAVLGSIEAANAILAL